MSDTNHSYNEQLEVLKNQDMSYNLVSTSRYLFYLQLFGSIICFLAMCYILWMHRYTGKPDVEIQSSTLYTPVYK